MMLTKEFISEKLKQKSSGIDAHILMSPKERRLIPDKHITPKKSSVLILLECKDNKLFTYLVKRSSNMNNHPGQIGFPGGKHDKNETLAETAIREAKEEIGYLGSINSITANLSPVYIPVSNFLISPFVAWVENEILQVTSPNEIDYIINFPISDFISENSKSIAQISINLVETEVPAYIYNDEIIWGATAMILSELIELIR